jgi:hypothetical protein
MYSFLTEDDLQYLEPIVNKNQSKYNWEKWSVGNQMHIPFSHMTEDAVKKGYRPTLPPRLVEKGWKIKTAKYNLRGVPGLLITRIA